MDNNIDFIVVQITQHPLTHVPPKLNSELTFWHSDDTTVLEHLLPSEISYYGPKKSHIIYMITKFCLHAVVTHISYDHHQN